MLEEEPGDYALQLLDVSLKYRLYNFAESILNRLIGDSIHSFD